jgi:hypothetical protein
MSHQRFLDNRLTDSSAAQDEHMRLLCDSTSKLSIVNF